MSIDFQGFQEMLEKGALVYDHEGDCLDIRVSRPHCRWLVARGKAVEVTRDHSIVTAIQLVGPGITNPIRYKEWD